MTPRRSLWTLIAVSTLVRLGWAACLGPGNDEAYYYLFTVHRDWSYYDHPPMTAWVAAVGLWLGGDASALRMRLGFVALFAGSTWLMARLTTRLFGDERAGVLAALALNASAYFGTAASTFALPDGPLVFFWLLTIERLAAALSPSGSETAGTAGPTWRWVGVGLAWGGALLSKYQAVFLPVGALAYLVLEPTARRCLRRPGPYLAVAVGLATFAPVLLWNARHGWASFAFQGARAVGGSGLRPDALAGALVGQALYLFPWMWAFLVLALSRRFRAGTSPAERFLICLALPPLVAFLAVACGREVLPHWSLAGFLAAMPVLGRDWSRGLGEGSKRLRGRIAIVSAAPLVAMAMIASQAAWAWLPIPAAHDPTAETVGWDRVADELDRRGLIGADAFLFTSTWFDSGQLAFALGGRSRVHCYCPRDPHGFAQWDDPTRQVGRDGILVTVGPSSTEPAMYDRWFERIEPLGGFEVVRAGRMVRTVRLSRCVQQTRTFPTAARGSKSVTASRSGSIHPPRRGG